MSDNFDRVRTRAADSLSVAPVDVQGKSALFSKVDVSPSLGSLAITCSGCQTATVVSYGRAVKLAVPSMHLPMVRRAFPSWMRCPACAERHWVRLDFH
jgi:uncharacterized protein with PIN domain